MYLLDTNIVSENRKQQKANIGVQAFLTKAKANNDKCYISVITLGELRRGVDNIRYKGDKLQASLLENWLLQITYNDSLILPFDKDCANIWGKLRVPHHENAIDKQIASIALVNDLTLVTRNTKDFQQTGVKLLNPFQ